VHSLTRRLLFAVGVFFSLVASSSLGFFYLGHGTWSLHECLYLAMITVATVGYGELPHMAEIEGARTLAMLLMVTSIGTLTYVQSTLTAVLVEGALGHALRRTRMRKAIQALSGHVVVAGSGSTGRHVIQELVATEIPFVVIDRNREHLERLSVVLTGGKMLYVHGDATEDQVLLDAGVERALGVVAALTHDKDNLYVTISARSLNAKARIVTKVVEDEVAPKMLRAGATTTVSPAQIGGQRLAHVVARPLVQEFLDTMHLQNLRIEDVHIPAGSPLAGVKLKDTGIRQKTELLVLAVQSPDGKFAHNPSPDHPLDAGGTLIVMGALESIRTLRTMVGED
jgi:voltage-gated potassium channel